MVTGKDLVELALKHKGEQYSFGARVNKTKKDYKGPWDCAEFVSYLVYQLIGKLYGCYDNNAKDLNNLDITDAYTGYWYHNFQSGYFMEIPLTQAVNTAGAILLRIPRPGAIGHISISQGNNKTIEAYSTKMGVIESVVNGRRWDKAFVFQEMVYSDYMNKPKPYEGPEQTIYMYKSPNMEAVKIMDIQVRLAELGFKPGNNDGIFGLKTSKAVIEFQKAFGLLADGEVGTKTWKALFPGK